jgi:hypothetical protein
VEDSGGHELLSRVWEATKTQTQRNRLQAEIQTTDFSNINFHIVHRFHGQQVDFSVRPHASSSLMKFGIGRYIGSCPVNFNLVYVDRLCGLVVRVSGYRSRGPGFDYRRYHIFWEVVGLERGSLSLVRIIEELLELRSSGSGLENWD